MQRLDIQEGFFFFLLMLYFVYREFFVCLTEWSDLSISRRR